MPLPALALLTRGLFSNLGHHIAIRNILAPHRMIFITIPDYVYQITVMKLSPNKKYLLVAEQLYKDSNSLKELSQNCYLSVYDVKNSDNPKLLKAHINVSEMAASTGNTAQAPGGEKLHVSGTAGTKDSGFYTNTGSAVAGGAAAMNNTNQNTLESQQHKKITQMSFSETGSCKYVSLIITDGVDSKVVVLDWISINTKVEAAMDCPKQIIHKATFNPKDDTKLCTTGVNHWKVWKTVDGSFKQMSQLPRMNQNHHYTEHCWLDKNKLISFTMDGEMYFLIDEDVKKLDQNAFNVDDNISHVVTIEKFDKGFYIASDQGEMAMWVKSEENNSTSGNQLYDFIRRWQPPATKGHKVLGMSVSSSQEYLAVAF